MNYSKIKEIVSKKFATQKEFLAIVEMKGSTYSRIFKEENTTVKTLEKISAALEVSPAFWWQEDTRNEADTKLGYIPKRVYEELMKMWKEDRERCSKIEQQLDFMRGLIDESKRKSAV